MVVQSGQLRDLLDYRNFEEELNAQEIIVVFELYALPELWGLRSFLNFGAYARRLPGPLGLQRAGPLQLSSRTLLSR